jgi:hypothetical protein
VTALDTHLDRFVTRVRARLSVGERDYGDASLRRPAAELVDELQQEVEDIAGWGLILWVRLERLRGAVQRLEGQGGRHG